MEKQSIAIQAFRVENRKIILDNLPSELYDNIEETVPEFYERIDEKAWVMEATTSGEDGIKYSIVMSRNKDAVKEFMNTVLFTEEILNA
jgi:hypothetical protein